MGYYSLSVQDNKECELNNLSVIPAYRHRGIGEELFKSCFLRLRKELNCNKINISIVEENKVLRKWYESFDFCTYRYKKIDFFPFTCGYMEKEFVIFQFAGLTRYRKTI